jgi:hypothetical protein
LGENSFQLSLDGTELSLGEKLKGTLSVKSAVEFQIEKIWVRLTCEEIAGKVHAILYDYDANLSNALYVYEGFQKEFPFVIKLPSVGRETYHSIHQNVQWFVDAYIKVKGTKNAISTERGIEIFVTKPIVVPTTEVPTMWHYGQSSSCPACGKQVEEDDNFCPNCAKPLRP